MWCMRNACQTITPLPVVNRFCASTKLFTGPNQSMRPPAVISKLMYYYLSTMFGFVCDGLNGEQWHQTPDLEEMKNINARNSCAWPPDTHRHFWNVTNQHSNGDKSTRLTAIRPGDIMHKLCCIMDAPYKATEPSCIRWLGQTLETLRSVMRSGLSASIDTFIKIQFEWINLTLLPWHEKRTDRVMATSSSRRHRISLAR